jgi:putative ABC transport system ATP-binding protein
MSREPLLTVHDLSWAIPTSGEVLFEGISFEVGAGQRVVLRGPSGSGKSTLLRCVIGLEPRRAGTVLWRGEEVGPHNMRRFRNRATYVQQRPTALAETVADNLEFARRMARELDAEQAPMSEDEQRQLCDKLGIEPDLWSRRFDDLSVGEQQRVCMVRTLTGRPQMLLLDEPTSALDPERVSQIEELLCDYVDRRPDERAFLWVSHQPEQIERLATRVIDLQDWLGATL